MKAWMKALMWLGMGFGFGYFIGDRVGFNRGKKEDELEESEAYEEVNKEPVEALKEYEGNDYDGDQSWTTDDDPEMPTEADIAIDPDIPQLHPQHLIPEIIGEEEFNINIWQYDLENLLFYEIDEVLYNETTQSIIENPDDVVGVGTLFEFNANPLNQVDTIYVKNDTFGTLFRIDKLDAAFCDAVDGTCGPEDDDPEDDDDFTKEDYWNDV